MLRFVLLAFYLVYLCSSGQTKLTGNLGPDGLTNQPPQGPMAEGGGGLDPDG
jgi:hypothetical protein